jgi:hypothetical protein
MTDFRVSSESTFNRKGWALLDLFDSQTTVRPLRVPANTVRAVVSLFVATKDPPLPSKSYP